MLYNILYTVVYNIYIYIYMMTSDTTPSTTVRFGLKIAYGVMLGWHFSLDFCKKKRHKKPPQSFSLFKLFSLHFFPPEKKPWTDGNFH